MPRAPKIILAEETKAFIHPQYGKIHIPDEDELDVGLYSLSLTHFSKADSYHYGSQKIENPFPNDKDFMLLRTSSGDVVRFSAKTGPRTINIISTVLFIRKQNDMDLWIDIPEQIAKMTAQLLIDESGMNRTTSISKRGATTILELILQQSHYTSSPLAEACLKEFNIYWFNNKTVAVSTALEMGCHIASQKYLGGGHNGFHMESFKKAMAFLVYDYAQYHYPNHKIFYHASEQKAAEYAREYAISQFPELNGKLPQACYGPLLENGIKCNLLPYSEERITEFKKKVNIAKELSLKGPIRVPDDAVKLILAFLGADPLEDETYLPPTKRTRITHA